MNSATQPAMGVSQSENRSLADRINPAYAISITDRKVARASYRMFTHQLKETMQPRLRPALCKGNFEYGCSVVASLLPISPHPLAFDLVPLEVVGPSGQEFFGDPCHGSSSEAVSASCRSSAD